MGKTNPLYDDLIKFIELQKTFADSRKSWCVDIAGIAQPTFDLTVNNPDVGEETIHRSPQDIMNGVAALNYGSFGRNSQLID
jgi:type I restriction enzyme M protein